MRLAFFLVESWCRMAISTISWILKLFGIGRQTSDDTWQITEVTVDPVSTDSELDPISPGTPSPYSFTNLSNNTKEIHVCPTCKRRFSNVTNLSQHFFCT